MKTIQLTEKDFEEISTDVAAKVCAVLEDPKVAFLSATLLALIARELFSNEELIIDEEEQ